jgi:gliding motility-associated-like protein
MHHLVKVLIFAVALFLWHGLAAQYISRSEPSPTYTCPTVCQGGMLELKIPQIENFPAGTLIQAWLSNSTGSFAAGTQTLNATQYSTNNGTTWLAGPYAFSSNINNLLMRITIPIATPLGNAYTIKMRASNGYVSNDLFQCGGSNSITVTAATTPLPPVLPTTSGNGQWLGHVYTWTPTTTAVLNTPALVSAQNFFAPANYQGHAVYNPLNIDLFFSASGGVPGSSADASSFLCGTAYTTNFSMQLRRTENFAPGLYHLSIQGDDGIRLSVDGGATWLLSSFLEQPYASSYKTTQTNSPNGICLNGNTDLVIEYFQRPMDARLTFNVLSAGALPSFFQPQDVSACLPDGGAFSVTSNSGYTYQWFQSLDGGATFNALTDNPQLSGSATPSLNLLQTNAALEGSLYYCTATSSCGVWSSDTAALSLQNSAFTLSSPSDAVYCVGQPLSFSSTASNSGISYQWQVSYDGGQTFVNIAETPPYTGTQSNVLSIAVPPVGFENLVFRQSAQACGTIQYSNTAVIQTAAGASITQQPTDLVLCADETGNIQFEAIGYISASWELLQSSGNYQPLFGVGVTGISLDTDNNLIINGADLTESYYVLRCRLTPDCGNDLITQVCTLTVNSLVNIIQAPQDRVVCDGNPVSFSVQALGSGITYQWQVSSDGGTTFMNLVGSTDYTGEQSAELILNAANTSYDSALFRCLIFGTCDTLTTLPALLTISENAQLLAQPQSQTICEQEDALFVFLTNIGGDFQWEYSGDGGQTFNLCQGNSWATGAFDDSLFVSGISSLINGYFFRCAYTYCDTLIYSDTAMLTVLPLPELGTLDVPQLLCVGDTVQLFLQANNALSYQWQLQQEGQFINLENSVLYDGVNTPYLSILGASDSLDLRVFRCVVYGVCGGEKWSNTAALDIVNPPTVFELSYPERICSNENFSVYAQFNGLGEAYQWEFFDDIQDAYVPITDNEVYRGSQSFELNINASDDINGVRIRFLVKVCGDTICSEPITIQIKQDAPVYIPGAFTANGDNLNDVFKLYTDGNPVVYAEIYNSWGELLHVWDHVDEGWDGTYLGKPVQEGVYVYRIWIKTACSEKVFMRTITLMK